ncbi:hypothetical protein [Ectobacillus ponti]|uniref:Uncharacterized protein n=1 Tax=Ectobacillus ponti TaxID=2961894 RepID=A0AA42BRA1_9BACI|nr:hypothetical protein [Ectobacillus ponti]MCP8970707.1 hypothetical protein [Ectobacillus ponti]
MNYTIFQWMNRWAGHSPFLDYTMIMITKTVPYVAILLMLFLWFHGKGEKAVDKQYTALYAVFSIPY